MHKPFLQSDKPQPDGAGIAGPLQPPLEQQYAELVAEHALLQADWVELQHSRAWQLFCSCHNATRKLFAPRTKGHRLARACYRILRSAWRIVKRRPTAASNGSLEAWATAPV